MEQRLRKQVHGHPVTFGIVSFFLYIDRLERDIKAVETAKDISTRWGKHTDRFKKAHTRLEDKRKVGFLTRARSYALERIFHLALKRKYSGNAYCVERFPALHHKLLRLTMWSLIFSAG